MKKYLVLIVDLFVFVVLSGILHFAVAIVAREWAWVISNALSLSIIAYLRVDEIRRIEYQTNEFLRVADEVSNALDDILNPDEEPHKKHVL